MDKKIREIFTSKRLLTLVVLLTFIILLTFFFGDSGILEIIRTQKKIKNLTDEIVQLTRQRDNFREEIKDLKNDPLALEKVARKELWLMKENEKVIVIIKDDKN